MIDGGKIRFFLGQLARSFSRNLPMQLSAIATVAASIALLGSYLEAQRFAAVIGSQVLDPIEISALLTPALRPAAERALLARIAADPRVRSATFVPRAEGLRQLETRLRGEVDTSLLTQNPLPDAIRVHVSNPAAVSAVAAALGRMPGVADVVYARDAVARLLALWSVLERIGLGTLALLLLAAAIVISNAIRLTVFARRREIAIMQLVGGSGTYVRLPFICEGIVDGLLGALLALVLLALARAELFPRLVAALPFLPFESAARADPLLAAELVGIGAVVGAVAAWLAVGRYLRA